MNMHDGVRKEIRTRFIEGEGHLVEEVEIGSAIKPGQSIIPAAPAAPPLPVVVTIADVSLALAKQVIEANGLLAIPVSFLNEQQLEELAIDLAELKQAAKEKENGAAGETGKPGKKADKLTEAQAIKAVSAAASFEELNALTADESRAKVLAAAETRAAELKG